MNPLTDLDTGLTHAQVQQLVAQGQGNVTTANPGKTGREIVLSHVLTFFNLVFIVLAVVLALCGSSVKNMTFLIVVVINTVLGCVQQLRAKSAVDQLTLVAAQRLPVLRQGSWENVRSDLLVLGDIVRFSAGDQICADGLLRSGTMQVNEALITGEADPVVKQPGDNLLSGSFVLSGSGQAQLTAVGDRSFAARLSREAKADPKAAKSEMMSSLDKLICFVGIGLIPIGILLFCHQYFRLEMGLRSGAEATVAALVGMIPEGLYLLTSVAMAASSLKLSQKRVLVQDMNCIETLARVDVLCVDKTGTITQPEMALEQVIPLTDAPVEDILGALYGAVPPENDTARAIAESYPHDPHWECANYLSFTSQSKCCGGQFPGHGTYLSGAPEVLLGRELLRVQEYIREGYRVLLLARYDGVLTNTPDSTLVQPLALLLLRNPIRPDAPEIFRYFASQGVNIKVISGDNPQTVSRVAQQAGIPGGETYIDAATLHTPQDYARAVQTCTVFGRVTPEQKKSIIRALKEAGHTVAMTGDGVNDVLAMKVADCGIAMASGAQAASQMAQMVLLDSNFSAMPAIVGEGRRVINNIQRAATLFLVKNILSLGLALLTMATGLAYPFAPFHLTLISALTIGTPAFFLAMEPNYQRVRGKFLPNVLRQALPGGLTNIAVVLMAQLFMENFQIPMSDVRSVCTAILAFVGMLVLYKVCRPFDLFRRIVWGAMAFALIGSFLVLRGFFNLYITSSTALLLMAAMLVAALAVFVAMQALFRLADRLRR